MSKLKFYFYTKKALIFIRAFLFLSDLDWIQTSNLLSRNQVRYSVAPQGHFASGFNNLIAGAKIGINVYCASVKQNKNKKISGL